MVEKRKVILVAQFNVIKELILQEVTPRETDQVRT